MKTEITLKQIAEILNINESKSTNFLELDYYYYTAEEADKECIAAYHKDKITYTYFTAADFMDDHGFESIDDLNSFK